MNGCITYNKILRNLRNYTRCGNENDLSLELKRHFSISIASNAPKEKFYFFKSVFEIGFKKELWENIRNKCNEKLVVLGEILTRQCNFVASQRVRRMNQMWNLYQQLYSEKTIKQIVSQLVKDLRSKRKPLTVLLASTLFSWEKEKITDEEIQKCICEFDGYRNSEEHLTKPTTGQGLLNKLVEDGWECVIQKECIQVWRKAFPNSYLYEYKIMGTFYDVPARTFFAVQTDIEYRKKWDRLVIKLDSVDKENIEGGCEVMHWVMHYPYPMYSREYVYIRRAVISPETNSMVLVSRSIKHPCCPDDKRYVRVSQYSSRMVIRPHRTYDDNGFDYVLTYFDDPQAAFPTPAYNWMASSGVPDFVEKLHNAARDLYLTEQKSKPSPFTPKPSIEPYSSGNYECIYI